MHLSPARIETLDRHGFLVLPDLFTPREIDVLRAEVPDLMAEISPDNTRESSGSGVRNMLGLHRRNAVFSKLATIRACSIPPCKCWVKTSTCSNARST